MDRKGEFTIAKNRLRYNGKAFFWLADTWWYGMTSRTDWNKFRSLVKDRKRKGFTVIQTVVGVPPEIEIFSKESANSGGTPFTKDLKINYKYFKETDKKINYLVKNSLIPCIFGAWGQHIDILGADLIKRWWKEIIKRYSNYPVIFCLTGEADIFPQNNLITNTFRIQVLKSLIPNKLKQIIKFIIRKKSDLNNLMDNRLDKWDQVAKYIKKLDNDSHLLTVHIHKQKTASSVFNNPDWLDIDSIQSGHSKNSIIFMKKSINKAFKKREAIINLEPWYEGILNNFDDYYQRLAFWTCILSGSTGYTYGAHGVWQMSDNDNFMGHWGKSDWKEAMNYNGSNQIGLGKKFLEKYDFGDIQPISNLVSCLTSRSNKFIPLSAKIKKNTCLVYFPKFFKFKVYKINENFKIRNYKWIDPKNMEVTDSVRIDKNLIKTEGTKYNSTDQILMLTGSL